MKNLVGDTMKKSISNKFAYLSLVLTIGMVIYHAKWVSNYNISYLNGFDNSILNSYIGFADHIGFVCMVFFFFASAFWFYRNINSKEELISKYKKRLKTLLIPFIAWTIIIGIYQIITGQLTFKLSGIFDYLFFNPIAGPLWYILGLFILQLFAPIILLIKKNKLVTTGIFSLIIVYVFLRTVGVIPNLLSFPNWWWYNNLIYYVPAYLIGVYMGMYHSDLLLIKEYNEKKYTYIGIGLLIISIVFWTYYNIKALRIIYCFMELIGIWFIFKPKFCEKDIKEFFKSNFYIFSLHNPVLIPITNMIIVRYLSKIVTLCGITTVITKLIQIAIIVLISCIIRLLTVKIIPKLDEYLTGGR